MNRAIIALNLLVILLSTYWLVDDASNGRVVWMLTDIFVIMVLMADTSSRTRGKGFV